jgi:hypothetical protein
MKRIVTTTVLTAFALLIGFAAGGTAQAQDSKTPYPNMAPVDQYMMERDAEIAMARSAAPDSVSHDAEVLVLGPHGYETAVKGTNGFLCMVERSWSAPLDDSNFWNPKLRGPICFNPPAVRSYVPQTLRKTRLILATRSKTEMAREIKAAFDHKELPLPESGAMCYMLSKQGYLSDSDGHWHPHLMFFLPLTEPAVWGADLPGSPIFSNKDELGRMTVFMVPVAKWSDGTPDSKEH